MNEHKRQQADGASEHDAGRRDALKRGACGCLGMAAAAVWPEAAQAQALPQRIAPGDRLVVAGADGAPKPLNVADIKVGAKPVIVYPFDAQTQKVRDARANRILLVRLDQAGLDGASKSRAAEGVLAFSATCTHMGCDVSDWSDADKKLVCPCHQSRYDPLKAGKVVTGPATRDLAVLSLASEGGQLVVKSGLVQPSSKQAA